MPRMHQVTYFLHIQIWYLNVNIDKKTFLMFIRYFIYNYEIQLNLYRSNYKLSIKYWLVI